MNCSDSGDEEESTERTSLMSGQQESRGYDDGEEGSEARRQRQAEAVGNANANGPEAGGDAPQSGLDTGFENMRNQERVSRTGRC